MSTQDLETPFNAALTHVERSLATGMKTADGDSARVARPALS